MTAIIEAAETNYQLEGLVEIFDTALANAKVYVDTAQQKNETLSRTARSFYLTFKRAGRKIDTSGNIPIIPGTDSHNQEAGGNPYLARAISGVYGFTNNGAQEEKSPNTVKALRAMQPIAAAMHHRGLCIYT